MLYLKNLPRWERGVRLLAGFAVVACGLNLLQTTAYGGWMVVAVGAVSLVTGVVGFCPACALAGRRLDKRLKTEP